MQLSVGRLKIACGRLALMCHVEVSVTKPEGFNGEKRLPPYPHPTLKNLPLSAYSPLLQLSCISSRPTILARVTNVLLMIYVHLHIPSKFTQVAKFQIISGRFESRLRPRTSWYKFFVVFLSPSRWMVPQTRPWMLPSMSFLKQYSQIRRPVTYDNGSAVKLSINKSVY
jgi:hypothetical protein